MSTKLNGNRYSRRGDRVPVNLLPSAIAWEECRTQVCMAMGRTSDAYRAAALKRYFEDRLIQEG